MRGVVVDDIGGERVFQLSVIRVPGPDPLGTVPSRPGSFRFADMASLRESSAFSATFLVTMLTLQKFSIGNRDELSNGFVEHADVLRDCV